MSMSNAPGVGTSVNVKSPPEVWGRPGVGLEIDRCIMWSTAVEDYCRSLQWSATVEHYCGALQWSTPTEHYSGALQ